MLPMIIISALLIYTLNVPYKEIRNLFKDIKFDAEQLIESEKFARIIYRQQNETLHNILMKEADPHHQHKKELDKKAGETLDNWKAAFNEAIFIEEERKNIQENLDSITKAFEQQNLLSQKAISLANQDKTDQAILITDEIEYLVDASIMPRTEQISHGLEEELKHEMPRLIIALHNIAVIPIRNIHSQTEKIQRKLVHALQVQRFTKFLYKQHKELMDVVLMGKHEDEMQQKEFQMKAKDTFDNWVASEKPSATSEELEAIENIGRMYEQSNQSGFKALSLKKQGNKDQAFKELIKATDYIESSLIPQVEQVVFIEESEIKEKIAHLNSDITYVTNGIIVLSAFFLILGVGSIWMLSRKIIFPILTLRDAADRISKGELTEPIKSYSRDEIGDLAQAFDTMRVNLDYTISELKREIAERRKNEERFRAVSQTASDAIITIDISGNILFWNKAAEHIFGYSSDDVIGKPARVIMPERFRDAHRDGFNRVISTGKSDIIGKITEVIGMRKDGSEFPLELSLARWESGEEIFFTGICREITMRKQMEEELRNLSLVDELTGLHNRRGFLTFAEQHIKIATRMKRELFLFFADLDNMKWINDTLGHSEGDRALIDIAHILKETFRETDIIARMGGDEFAILAIESSKDEAILTRLQDKINSYNAKGGRRYKLSISIGVVCYRPESPCSVYELLSQADKLMYEQKQRKKKNVAGIRFIGSPFTP